MNARNLPLLAAEPLTAHRTASAPVQDWTLADLHAYLAAIGGRLDIEPPDALVPRWRVWLRTSDGGVRTEGAFLDALASAVRKYEALRHA